MKEDERKFLDELKCVVGSPYIPGSRPARMAEFIYPRDVINRPGFYMHHKRAWEILSKWTRKDWYEYGVTLDLGWMTEKGMAA